MVKKNNKKNIMMLLIIMFLLIYFSNFVFSLGIAPSYKEVKYDEGRVYNGKIKVFTDKKVVLSVKGEYSKYLELEKNYLEKTGIVNYKLKMYSDIKPGDNIFIITATEIPEDKGMLSSALSVNAKIVLKKPITGKYLEYTIYPITDKKEFIIKTKNLGLENISNVLVELQFFENNTLIRKYYSEETPLNVGEEKFLKIPIDLTPGDYNVKIIIHYDDKAFYEEKKVFLKGKIEYLSLTNNNFKLKEINKFLLTLKNNFNKNVNFKVTSKIIQNNIVKAKYEMNDVIEKNSIKEMPLYFDTKSVDEGRGIIKTTISYLGYNDVYEENYYFKYNKAETSGLVSKEKSESEMKTILIIILIFLILNFVLVLYLFINSKNKKKKIVYKKNNKRKN